MVIGIDARESAAGKGRYVQELLKRLPELAPDTEFYFYTKPGPDAPAVPSNVTLRPVSGSGPLWHARVANAANKEANIYFSTVSYQTPQFLRLPFIQTVFDLIVFKPFATPQRWAKMNERTFIKRALGRASGIFTISQATADDLATIVPASSGKITVTPLAADTRFKPDYPEAKKGEVRKRLGIPPEFILFTGTIEPRKNLTRLVTAYEQLPTEIKRSHALVLVGRKGWQYEPVFKAIEESPDRDRIIHADSVSDEDLAVLYADCTMFCYPTLYEGFGLPVLEAMQSGAPVITSNTSSLPEVGGDAVRYVEPASISSITDQVHEVLKSEAVRRKMSADGLQQARHFSWEQTARQTLEVLQHAARPK